MSMYVKQLNAYTVAQLKEELTSRNLETTGKKADLVVRLAGYLEEHVDDEMVEALALGELPKKGTPTKSEKEADTSEIIEEEEEENAADITNGMADTSGEADKDEENVEDEVAQDDTKGDVSMDETKEDVTMDETKEDVTMDETKEDASAEEVKENGEVANTEAETSEQTMKKAMAESSDLKVLDEVGPDDEEDTKKDEETKKKKKRKQMLSWPRLDELLQERRLALKQRTIVIGPVEVTDLDNEIIRQIASEAESFHYKTATIKNTDTNKGIINACLKDKETCEAFVEKLSGFRDSVRVEQCGFNMSQEKFFREIVKEDEEDEKPKPERMEYRTAIIRNLPEEPDEDKLKELFPDAPNLHIVRDQEGKCKGWAYVEFKTSKDGQEFIDAYKNKEEEQRPKMEDEVLRVGTLQHIRKLYVDVTQKEDKEKTKDRPEGLLSDEERIRKPQLIRMWKQRLTNLESLKKTRPEYYEKQKKALEENIKKAETAVQEDDEKRKELGIPIPEPKKEAEKKKDDKKDKNIVRPMKRKAPGVPGRSEYRPIKNRRDFMRRDSRGSGMGSMTREQWQRNRSGWSSGGSGQAATANAVNLLVGLSKIFGNQQAGGSSYSQYSSQGGMSGGYSSGTFGGYSGGSSFWNQSGSNTWGTGTGSGRGYSGGYSSPSGPSSKRRRPQILGGKRQEQLDQMRIGRR